MSDKTDTIQGTLTDELPTAPHAWAVLISIFVLSVVTAIAWMCMPSIQGAYAAVYGAQSMASFGNLMQFVSYGALVAAVLAAPLAQLLGIKGTLIVAGACTLAGNVIVALSGVDTGILFAGRAVLGLGVGFTAVTAVTALGIWFPLKTRGMAMAIWAVWVPVAMLIIYNAANPIIGAFGGPAAGGFHGLFWVISALVALGLLLVIVIYRAPREGEASATIRKKVPLRQALPHLAKPQLIAVAVTWLVFNAVNQCNTTYIVTFMQQGYGFAPGTASLLGSIASAAGIAAIIFGFISDRLQVPKKYLLIVISAASLTLAMVLGFKPADTGSVAGMAQFVAYLVCMFIGNAGLVACVRPYVPMLVGKGGVIAIGYALAGVTILQYVGQMFATPFGAIVDSIGGVLPRDLSQVSAEMIAQHAAAFEIASWILVGIGAVGLVAAFFLKIKTAKPQENSDAK